MPRVINTTYEAYISGPFWKAKRAARLQIDDYKCSRCPSDENLQVHHLTYERLGRERMSDLVTLCADCHAKEHGRDPSLPQVIGSGPFVFTTRQLDEYTMECWQRIVADTASVSAQLESLFFYTGYRDDPRAKHIRNNLKSLMRDWQADHEETLERDRKAAA